MSDTCPTQLDELHMGNAAEWATHGLRSWMDYATEWATHGLRNWMGYAAE
jgi:hypothetical protein